MFKWDKEQTDRQPTQYLKRTIAIAQKRIEDILAGISVKT